MKELISTVLLLIMFLFANVQTRANLTQEKQPFATEVKVNAIQRIQGEVLAVQVKGVSDAPQGTFIQMPLKFYPYLDGWIAFTGISYNVEPGSYQLIIELADDQRIEQAIQVDEGNFKKSYITVSESQATIVDPKPADQTVILRKEEDQKKVKLAYSQSESTPLWTKPFIRPTEGRVTTEYGYTRYVNGKLNNRHSGWDIANLENTNIYAVNDGIVRLAEELLVTGKTIIIDHGVGVFSSYSHMNTLLVKSGEHVSQGKIIGKMGSTGVSTGSHLHWVMRIGDAYLHPGKFVGTDVYENIIEELKL